MRAFFEEAKERTNSLTFLSSSFSVFKKQKTKKDFRDLPLFPHFRQLALLPTRLERRKATSVVSPWRRGVWGESLDLSRGGKYFLQIVDRPPFEQDEKARDEKKNCRPFVAHRDALLPFKVSQLRNEACKACDITITGGVKCSDRAQGRFLRPIPIAFFSAARVRRKRR